MWGRGSVKGGRGARGECLYVLNRYRVYGMLARYRVDGERPYLLDSHGDDG